MRSQLIAVVAGAAALLASGASGAAPRHEVACMPARIGGRLQCLAPGLQCKSRYEHVYNLYGLTCVRDADGRLRLRDRLYIGPPVPEPGG